MANKICYFFLVILFTLYLNDIDSLLAVDIDETQEESLSQQEERHFDTKVVEEKINAKDYVDLDLDSDETRRKSETDKSYNADDDSGSHVYSSNDNGESEATADLTNDDNINGDASQEQFEQTLKVVPEEESSNVPLSTESSSKDTIGDTMNLNSENANFASRSDEKTTNADDLSKHNEDVHQEMKADADGDNIGAKKHRHFSLLYTFGTLFNSLLSEFGDVSGGHHDAGYNSSEKEVKNSSVLDEALNDTNTSNNTDSGKKTRFQCALRNSTENTIFEVKIVNSTELLEILNFSKNQKLSPCVLVMFYAPWCYFCAKTAPHYNALARAFPQLNILAVDTSHFSYLNARFGTVAVPNVMLFHSRSAVRFNHTTRDLDHFIQFVTNNTGLESNKSVLVEPFDYEGPLSSQVVQKRDWLLWTAWVFVIVCSAYFFVGSLYGQAFITRIRVLWQEHQHIE